MMIFKEKFLNGPAIHLDILAKGGQIVKSSLKAATEAAFFCSINYDANSQRLIDSIFRWLNDYINKKNSTVSLPYSLVNLTDFQKKVCQTLLNIPLGTTCSYQDIALMIGSRQSARAVGNACNKNPFPLFIPCHRVIKKNMEIGGFALPISIKNDLLSFEKK